MLLAVALAYVIGSVPFALLLARRWGTADLRTIGSGNLGATNVIRATGVTAGIAVLVLDVAKGAFSVTLAHHLTNQSAAPAVAGLAAMLGHVYPVWLRFRGGKGVATALGVFSVLAPLAIAPVLAVFAITAWLTKYISLASLLASLAMLPSVYLVGGSAPVILAAVAASALIVFTHRANLARLQLGREWRFGSIGAAVGGRRDT